MSITASNLIINVKDMDKSIAFYQSIGLTFVNRWGNHYAQIGAPGLIIGLHPTSDDKLRGSTGNVSIGFTTDDFDGAKTLLQSLSILITERQEEGGKFLHFDDPGRDGHLFYKAKMVKSLFILFPP